MIIGPGFGEGGPEAGAASADTNCPTDPAAVRTRAQLDKLVRLKARAESKKKEEIDESLLDEDSESEDKGSRGDSAMDADSASEDVFRDEEKSAESGSESGVSPLSTQDVFEIGKGHAMVIAARKAASCRRHLNPSPTSGHHH